MLGTTTNPRGRANVNEKWEAVKIGGIVAFGYLVMIVIGMASVLFPRGN